MGSGLDNLEWVKVRLLIEENLRTSPVSIVVYLREQTSHQQTEEIFRKPDTVTGDDQSYEPHPLAIAQEVDESLKHVRKWVAKCRVPRHNDLQGLPRLGWQRYKSIS